MKLIYLPIESLAERYTQQWYDYFPKVFSSNFSEVLVVDGEPLQDTIKVGTFLDINSTCHYKFTQLAKLAKMFDAGQIEEGTVIFFGDIEFWGLESVRLMSQMNNVTVKIAAFLHAASHTRGDAFSVANDYQKHTEIGWVKAVDIVFCGTEYAKYSFLECHHLQEDQKTINKFRVVGNPLFEEAYEQIVSKKEKLVVLTNRFDSEKGIVATMQLFYDLKQIHPTWKFAILTGRSKFTSNCKSSLSQALAMEKSGILSIHFGLTKHEYHTWLSRASIMVSHSPEENFGYCIVEADLYGCAPLVYDTASLFPRSSHRELVQGDKKQLFRTNGEAIDKAELLMNRVVGGKYVNTIHKPYLDSAKHLSTQLYILGAQ
jgi:hypothetical protein